MLLPEGDDQPPSSVPVHTPDLFPPALIPELRARWGENPSSLTGVSDSVLSELLMVIFFAGLETHEGVHVPLRVAFAGHLTADVLLAGEEAPIDAPMLLYRWSTLRLVPDRPYFASELVKLGIVTRSERVYTKVELGPRGLRIVGLAREGENSDGDPYLKVLAPTPGILSLRRGHESLVEYERGRVGPGVRDVILANGIVRRRLEAAARNAGVDDASIKDYLGAVRSIVAAMGAHRRGGILVVSDTREPDLPARAAYRTPGGGGVAELLHYFDAATGARRSGPPSSPGGAANQLRRVLRGAFLREADRWIAELGGLTAMDGATILDCCLRACGFGVVLPVARELEVVEARDPEAFDVVPYELSTRGTRHRAATAYAWRFPQSVVFVASHDGPISAIVASPAREAVLLWRLGSSELL